MYVFLVLYVFNVVYCIIVNRLPARYRNMERALWAKLILKMKKKSKKPVDHLIVKALNYKRKEVWLPPDIVLKLRILSAKENMSSKAYYEQVLTNHANSIK